MESVNVLSAADLRRFLISDRFKESVSGPSYLRCVLDYVSKHRQKSFMLNKPAGARWRIGGLDDTIYRGKHDEVEGWGKFYLPETVNMQVVGVVEGTSCPCEQLVLMTCEDGKLYAYDGEELHVVAYELHDVPFKGLEYPASKTYYNGEAFKDMTEEDWAEVRAGVVGRSLDKEHHKLVTSKKSTFMEKLTAASS